jgi:hypothetical protein
LARFDESATGGGIDSVHDVLTTRANSPMVFVLKEIDHIFQLGMTFVSISPVYWIALGATALVVDVELAYSSTGC